MGREKRSTAGPSTAKDRHRRAIKEIDRNAPLPPGLVARKAAPISKHKTVLELVENKDFKKKPLDFKNTTQREPPSLFSFVPLGNPELTLECKELSRERGAMVYIVSNRTHLTTDLSHQMNRVGYHFRTQIVQSAMESLGIDAIYQPVVGPHGVEVIPDSQQEINEQANAALLELFPKIPHTDRAEIISHAFRKGQVAGGEPLVGLQPSLSLFRRVQLAVLAHIRHNHTRYDKLLKETSWSNARRVTEEVCLDFLVKWRGDDESGRDQLDEIIREVVVLSDDDESDDDGESSSDVEILSSREVTAQAQAPAGFIPGIPSGPAAVPYGNASIDGPGQPRPVSEGPQEPNKPKCKSKKALKRERRKNRKGFKRYEANNKRYETAWDDAVRRNREAADAQRMTTPNAVGPRTTQNGFASHGSSPRDPQMHMSHGDQPLNGFDREPVYHRNARTPQGGPSSGFGSHGGVHHSAPSPLAHGFSAAEYSPEGQVAEHVYGAGAPPRAWPVATRQTQLQDMLHPSIEPLSPGATPRGQSYRSMVSEPYPAQRHNLDPAGEVIVIREPYEPEPTMYPSLQLRHEDRIRRREPEPRYEERAPVNYTDAPRYRGVWEDAAAAPGSSTWVERQSYAGERIGAHPGHLNDFRPGQSRPLPEGVVLLNERSRTKHRVWPAQEAHSYRHGFMVLREHPQPEEQPRNEPFIQLREAPVIYSESGRFQDAKQPLDPHRAYAGFQELPHHARHASGEARYPHHEPSQQTAAFEAHGRLPAHPHEQLAIGRAVPVEHPPSAEGSGYRHYSHNQRQAPRTPLRPSHDVIVIDS